MNILIAPDKFKGSLSAQEVAKAIGKGIERSAQQAQYEIQILADGGEGSLEIIAQIIDTQTVKCSVSDPLGREIEAKYLISGEEAYIEIAEASGLVLLSVPERSALKTSTLGTGQLIRDAIQKGAKRIYLFLGGSATNDAGMGIAEALGFRFKDQAGQVISPIGANLGDICTIDASTDFDWQAIEIFCLCDVQNPLLGEQGATSVYGPQKGASQSEVEYLERGMTHLSQLLSQYAQKEIGQILGGGAAGGIAAGLFALLNAEIQSGIETILQLSGLEAKVQQADLVISGEGKLDSQTLSGKVINGLSQLCQRHDKPLWLFVGQHDLSPAAIQAIEVEKIYSVIDVAVDIDDAMQNTAQILEKLAFEAIQAHNTTIR
ncbi:MAG: glycerate kinase [Bacteroidia bacterium]